MDTSMSKDRRITMNELQSLKAIGVNTQMVMRFASLDLARREAMSPSRTVPALIVMGTNARYWVMSARDAAKCRKAGYEMATLTD